MILPGSSPPLFPSQLQTPAKFFERLRPDNLWQDPLELWDETALHYKTKCLASRNCPCILKFLLLKRLMEEKNEAVQLNLCLHDSRDVEKIWTTNNLKSCETPRYQYVITSRRVSPVSTCISSTTTSLTSNARKTGHNKRSQPSFPHMPWQELAPATCYVKVIQSVWTDLNTTVYQTLIACGCWWLLIVTRHPRIHQQRHHMNRNMKGVIHCDMLYLAPYGNDRSEGNQGIVLDDTAMCQWQHIQSTALR